MTAAWRRTIYPCALAKDKTPNTKKARYLNGIIGLSSSRHVGTLTDLHKVLS